MNLSEPFVRRPVATTLLTIGLALAGALAFKLLPVAPLPQVDYPTLSVSVSLPGASPETMAATVATPLERSLGRIAGVTEITSSSTLGNSRLTLQFDLDRDIDGAARDVQAAINAARTLLPTGMPSNPSYRKVNPADAPVLLVALTSPSINLTELNDYAENLLSPGLSTIDGVAQVSIYGQKRYAVRIKVRNDLLNRRHVVVHEPADDRLLHLCQHRLEQDEAFALVFVERVLLGPATEADALSQVVHLLQVVAPEVVDGFKNRVLLDELKADLGSVLNRAPVKLRRHSNFA